VLPEDESKDCIKTLRRLRRRLFRESVVLPLSKGGSYQIYYSPA
jgi:hypothetical protein